MKKSFLPLLFLCICILSFAEPPKPPLGKRWVLNPDFSDEFNGMSLDTAKWLDHHPTWKGREPGLFMPSQISVKDGFLQIRGEKMGKDTVIGSQTFNVKCGAVVSKKPTFLGYYECVITSYSIHYTKLYDAQMGLRLEPDHALQRHPPQNRL